jgi:hypothetical protein
MLKGLFAWFGYGALVMGAFLLLESAGIPKWGLLAAGFGIWWAIESNRRADRHQEILDAIHGPDCLACRGRKVNRVGEV